MLSLSKMKQSFGNSRLIPATYTFFTKPFSKRLRRLPESPKLPKIPQKVTAAVPNYNYAGFLEARLNSILTQTYPVSELIILDDASTDDSVMKIKTLIDVIKPEYPDLKVKFIKNSENSGKSIFQWQKAFCEASGDFLWLAEADDLSDPDFLATVMQKFETDEKALISFSNSVAINSRGSVLTYDFANRSVDKLGNHRFEADFILSGEEVLKNEFAINCIIPNVSAAVFRLDKSVAFEKYLAKAAEFSQCGDWYFYLSILKRGNLAYSRPALNYFRIHQNSVTANAKKSETILREVKVVHSLIKKKYSLDKKILSAIKKEEARLANRLI